MTSRLGQLALAACGAFVFVCPVCAQGGLTKEQKEFLMFRAKLHRTAVQEFLKDKGEVVPPPIVWLENGDVRKSFPDYFFYIVRYPKFPEPQAPARGLKQSNIVAVYAKKDDGAKSSAAGKVTLLASTKDLMTFFKEQYTSPTGRLTPEEAGAVLHAWLRLSREITQDGHYRFLQRTIFVERRGSGVVPQVPAITGRAVVSTGGKGEIMVTIDFNTIPRVVRILERNTVRPGRRPRVPFRR